MYTKVDVLKDQFLEGWAVTLIFWAHTQKDLTSLSDDNNS